MLLTFQLRKSPKHTTIEKLSLFDLVDTKRHVLGAIEDVENAERHDCESNTNNDLVTILLQVSGIGRACKKN